MTYAPPYAAPVPVTDPTNVMGRRIGAYFIDVVVPVVVAFVVGFSIWLSNAHEISNVPTNYCNDTPHHGYACLQTGHTAYLATNSDTGRAIVIGLLIWLIAPLNAIVLQGITGATVGKFMFGLRVVRGDGSIAGFGWVALRSLLFIVDNMCFALVGLISASVTHPHRRVGDMAAGTFVVGKDNVGRAVAPSPAYAATAPPYPTTYAPPPTWAPPQAGTAAGPAPATSDPSAAGWAAPEPEPPTTDTNATPPTGTQWHPPAPPQAAPPPPVQDPTEPHWDPARNAWIAWEPTRAQWMQFDATTNEWRVM